MRVVDIQVGLLTYFVGIQNIYAVLVDQRGNRCPFQLMTCDRALPLIHELFDALQQPLQWSPQQAARVVSAFCFDWGKELLPPTAAFSSFDVLIIIPHYALHGLPFHIVWQDDRHQFLAASHGVTYCSSGTLFSRCVERNVARLDGMATWRFTTPDDPEAVIAPRQPQSCVSVGTDVRFNLRQDYFSLAKLFAERFELNLYHLPYRSYIKESSYDVICAVCHGYYDSADVDNSGLMLEKDLGIHYRNIFLHGGVFHLFRDFPFRSVPAHIRTTHEAEILTMNELKAYCYIRAQLVALFGCSTGAGTTRGSDFDSLAYQWLKIGAASTLANLWESDFEFTRNWSMQFLTNWLEKRQPKAIAWRETNAQILQDTPDMPSFLWGAIALHGDWV